MIKELIPLWPVLVGSIILGSTAVWFKDQRQTERLQAVANPPLF